MPIESKMVSKAVNQAQAKVEGFNFDLRKHLLDFDDVLNKQRTAIYRKRVEILEAGEKNEIQPVLAGVLGKFSDRSEVAIGTIEDEAKKEEALKKLGEFRSKIEKLPEKFEPERASAIGEHLVRIIDMLWVNHLESLEALRESVNIRAYGQHEPLVEYRREAHILYQDLNKNFEDLVSNTIWPILDVDLVRIKAHEQRSRQAAPPPEVKNIGRNDPCWCGAKHEDGRPKKYKKCHGA